MIYEAAENFFIAWLTLPERTSHFVNLLPAKLGWPGLEKRHLTPAIAYLGNWDYSSKGFQLR